MEFTAKFCGFHKPGKIQRVKPSETESETKSETEALVWQFHKPSQIQRVKPSQTETETEALVWQFHKFGASDRDLLYYYLKDGIPETMARQPMWPPPCLLEF